MLKEPSEVDEDDCPQEQIMTVRQTSPALHGMYHFLEQLRGLKTATEQATQTFSASQAEERFHPQLEALLVTWPSNKLPEVVRKRALNRRPQPSARILLTEFYFLCFHSPTIKPNILAISHEIRLPQVKIQRMSLSILRHGGRQFRCSRISRAIYP